MRTDLNTDKFDWPPEAKTYLQELWERRISDSQSAAAINERFNCRVTRNAVIGQRHRMGLTLGPMNAGGRISNRERNGGYKHASARPKNGNEIRQAQEKKVLLREVELKTIAPFACTPVTFMEREGCSWPMEGELYCNNPVVRPRISYCAHHFFAATRRSEPGHKEKTGGSSLYRT
jgi:hypothetical protein